MGLLEDVVRGLIKVFCGGSRPEDDKPQYGQSNAPPQQQQQQYPPLQHQQQSGYPGANAHQGQPHAQPHQSQGKPHHKPQHTQQDRPEHHSSPTHGKPHSPDHHASSPPAHHGSPSGQKPYHGQDPNQINQHNEQYMALRAKANQEGDAMGKCFDQSHSAYQSGDGARAKELSEQGKAHQREMERLNDEASEWIFRENNTDSKPGEIDLHGLYVKEAIRYTDRSIQEARQRGDSEVHLIVGKGLHSAGHVAKIKPAIEDLMRKHNLVAALDPHNAGVLIVHLDGQTRGGERGMGADDISRKLERDEEQCVIM